MLVPLYGLLEGDTMALVIFAHDDWTMDDIVEHMRRSGGARVSRPETLAVFHGGARLQARATVRQSGLRPLDLVHLRIERTATRDSAASPGRERGARV